MNVSGFSFRSAGFAVLAVVSILALATSCSVFFGFDNPNLQTRSYSVGSFNRVEISSSIVASIDYGGSYEVEMQAPAEVFDYLDIYVSGSTLYVDKQPGAVFLPDWFGSGYVKATISLPSLTSVTSSGASTVKVNGVGAAAMSVDASGASRIDLNNIAGSTINYDVSGASVIDESGTTFPTVTVSVSGSSAAHTPYSSWLTGSLSGASVLYYRGSPSISLSVTSGSAIWQE